MATLLLSAAGSALGGALGGSVAGLGRDGARQGRGRAHRLGDRPAAARRRLGAGGDRTVERFRVMGSSEGSPLPRVFGRSRVAGQVIWSSRFLESVNAQEVGGKGGGGATVREYSYSVSLAIALCEGEVARIGRIWADGQAVDQSGLTLRLHPGVRGPAARPADRGDRGRARRPIAAPPTWSSRTSTSRRTATAFRSSTSRCSGAGGGRCRVRRGRRRSTSAAWRWFPAPASTRWRPSRCTSGAARATARSSTSTTTGACRISSASLDQLAAELPNVELGVAGRDLVRRRPALRPLHAAAEGRAGRGGRRADALGGLRARTRRGARWSAGSTGGRCSAGRRRTRRCCRRSRGCASGQAVMFYPFILMDIQAGQRARRSLDAARRTSRAVPWRGRITLAEAPGRAGSTRQDRRGCGRGRGVLRPGAARGFRGCRADRQLHGPAGVVVPAVRAALRASLRAGRRRRRLLHRVGDARADANPRLGRRVSGGAGAVRAGGGRAGDPRGGSQDRLCGRLVGVFRASAGGRVGRRALSTSIRCGRRRRSISSESTTTCRFRTGATARATPTRRRGRSTTSTI